MKLTILQENLKKSLGLAAKFVSTKVQLPVLSHFFLEAKKNSLNICSTNLETSVSVTLGAKVVKEGSITVPARVLGEIVSDLKSGKLELEAKDEKLVVSTDSFSSSIAGMLASEFPNITRELPKESFSIDKDPLFSSLGQVVFAAGIDESRPALTGVLFTLDKDKTTLVATDGFRLSKKDLPVKLGVQSQLKLIVPARFISDILTGFFEEDREVKFSLLEREKQIVLGGSDFVLTSRLIEGEYPDYNRIIPTSSSIRLSLDKEDFLSSVKLISVFARESGNVFRIRVGKDKIGLYAESSAVGQGEISLPAAIEKEAGEEDFEIAFNWRFVSEFLSSAQGDDVQIELTSQTAPAVFKDPKDPGFLHLIMPVRI